MSGRASAHALAGEYDDHGEILCVIGVHRWVHKRNPDGGAYLECERCQKQKETVSIADQPGGDSGGAH
jgi:hypothetical protein